MKSISANNLAIEQQQAANYKWLIIVTIMLVAILEVLDSTIINVSLSRMMPALGANQEQITWVLTSYIVASAIMLPLTGFLSNRFGNKRLLLISITGFMISSACSGLAYSLTTMVIFRVLQGAFGATLIPLSQAILRQTFPLEEQGKAMAIWGIGVMVAPALGPTLGGYITEYSSWRWVFYINIPICIIGLLLTAAVIPPSKTIKQKIDWLGILLMFIGIGSLQIFLDQGNTRDWFSSNLILFLFVTSITAILFFLYRSFTYQKPAINLRIFKDFNFRISCILLATFCGTVFGLITLEPIMLETLFHFDTITAGITLSPLGISSAVAMVTASILMKKFSVKQVIIIGLLFSAAGAYDISTLNLDVSQHSFMIANSIAGFGMGLFMVPISTCALATIDSKQITEASGLFSYSRMLGTSVGISLLTTLVTRETQTSWNSLGSHISQQNNNLQLWLQHSHLTLHSPQTAVILGNQLLHQANMLAFVDAFFVIAIILVALIPFVMMLKTVKLDNKLTGAH